MKKYTSLGELIVDYRGFANISQANFAANLNVDVRTITRWEKNVTLLKPEKEDALVRETLMPYQLIRNLNTSKPIPTYYDFYVRKYSLNEVSTKLPKASWLRDEMKITTERMRPINFETDIDYIMKYIKFQKTDVHIVNKQVIREAIKLLPELNVIITDDYGNYAGHNIVFPLKSKVYEQLKNREIVETQLTVNDLANWKALDKPIFHTYDITVDCNDNGFYLLGVIFRFFKELQNKEYTVSNYTLRHDNIENSRDIGYKILWEDTAAQKRLGLSVPPRFLEGDFKDFLAD